MPFLGGQRLKIRHIVTSTLLTLCIISQPPLAQTRILNGKDEVTLTPPQQVVVHKLMGSEGTVNVRVVRKTAAPDGGSPDNRYNRLVLPLTDGNDITLTRTRPLGVTWRGATEATGERATLMLEDSRGLGGDAGCCCPVGGRCL